MLGRILTLIHKEILAVWRDKKSRFVLIVPPILQLLVFSMAATLDVKNVSIAVLNRDNGDESYDLIQRFHGSTTFKHILYLDSVEDIASAIDNQRAVMAIHIDEQFSRNLRAGKPAEVQFILDGRKSNTSQIVQGYASRVVEQYNRDYAKQVGYIVQNTELFPRNSYNPNLIYYWFNVPNLEF